MSNRRLKQAAITVTPGAEKTVIGIEVENNRVSTVLHSHRSFDEVVERVVEKLEEGNTQIVLKDANERLKKEYEKNTPGLPHPFDNDAVLAWYFALPDYETRWQKEDREAAEAKAALEAAKAERAAARAALES